MQDKTDEDLPILLAIVFILFVNLCAWSMLADGDTPWHIATGNWILDHLAIPRTDPFSHTFAGQPWHAHEWLAETLMAVAWRGASWSGVTLLFALSGSLLFLLLGLELRRWLSPLALVATLILVFVTLQPFFLARPHALAWPVLVLWTVSLLRARERDRPPPLVLALLMVLWANLHGSFLMGLALLAGFALESVLTSSNRLATLRQWLPFGLLSVAASLLTPYGINGLIFPLQVSGMSTLPFITEWRPTEFKFGGFELALIVALGTLLLRGVRIPLIRLIILLTLLHLAFAHIRHQPILGLIGALLVAAPLGRALRPDAALPMARASWRWADYPARRRRVIGLLTAAIFLVATLRLATPQQRPNGPSAPETAVAALPAKWRQQNGFNAYGFGGLLILNGFRPFIDGRADLYGDRFMRIYSKLDQGDVQAWQRAVARWDLRWAII